MDYPIIGSFVEIVTKEDRIFTGWVFPEQKEAPSDAIWGDWKLQGRRGGSVRNFPLKIVERPASLGGDLYAVPKHSVQEIVTLYVSQTSVEEYL